MTGWKGGGTIRHPDGTLEVLPGVGDPSPDVWCSIDDRPAYGTVNGLAFCHDDIISGRGRRFAVLGDGGRAAMSLSWAIKNGGAK